MARLSMSPAGLHRSPQKLVIAGFSGRQPTAALARGLFGWAGCPPHPNAPPAPPCPSTTLQSIPANLCCLAVPRSILDFRSFQGQTLAALLTLSQSCPCPRACTEPQHVLPRGTQPLPQHVPHPRGTATSDIMGVHHPREPGHQTVWGQVMSLLLYQDIAWLCSASLAPLGLGKQQS